MLMKKKQKKNKNYNDKNLKFFFFYRKKERVIHLGTGLTGVAGSNRILGLGGPISISSSASSASVSMEDRCWC